MTTTIVWFRQDLRTEDNPALHAAKARGRVISIFILDTAMAARFRCVSVAGKRRRSQGMATGPHRTPRRRCRYARTRQTGWMHNRVRMITASFLVKHLRIDWRFGEAWFWDMLLDADLANNAAGRQGVAGSGADASPYFRIFSPIAQGQKCDPNGDYVRRWCPELARLPDETLHAPFRASPATLNRAGIILGRTYPLAIVDHDQARLAALYGYQKIRAARSAARTTDT